MANFSIYQMTDSGAPAVMPCGRADTLREAAKVAAKFGSPAQVYIRKDWSDPPEWSCGGPWAETPSAARAARDGAVTSLLAELDRIS